MDHTKWLSGFLKKLCDVNMCEYEILDLKENVVIYLQYVKPIGHQKQEKACITCL